MGAGPGYASGHQTGHAVQLRCAQCQRVVACLLHAGAKLRHARRVAGQAALARCPVACGQVVQHHLHPGCTGLRRQLLRGPGVGEHAFHRAKARLRGVCKALQKRHFGEQPIDVGSKTGHRQELQGPGSLGKLVESYCIDSCLRLPDKGLSRFSSVKNKGRCGVCAGNPCKFVCTCVLQRGGKSYEKKSCLRLSGKALSRKFLSKEWSKGFLLCPLCIERRSMMAGCQHGASS